MFMYRHAEERVWWTSVLYLFGWSCNIIGRAKRARPLIRSMRIEIWIRIRVPLNARAFHLSMREQLTLAAKIYYSTCLFGFETPVLSHNMGHPVSEPAKVQSLACKLASYRKSLPRMLIMIASSKKVENTY